ncbi:MAG: hypothetical protein ACFFF4_07220 [Candidatus Thorarchaeota archaeon]
MNRDVKVFRVFTVLFVLISVSLIYSQNLTFNEQENESTGENDQNNEVLNLKEQETNQEQTGTVFFAQTPFDDNEISFVCRDGFHEIARFGNSEVYYIVDGTIFLLKFPGSNVVAPKGEDPTGSVTNYLYGNESTWVTGLEDYSVLRYEELYPGVNLIFRIHNGMLKYEFVVDPSSNPKQIHLRYSNADFIQVERESIFVSNNGHSISDQNLMVFQYSGKSSLEVSCSFIEVGQNEVAFSLGEYDASKTLIIDPLIVGYSTYFGNSGDEGLTGIVVEDGFMYAGGYRRGTDSFVIKFARDGSSIVYSSYFGGGGYDYILQDIDVEDGFSYVLCNTSTFGYYFRGKLAVDGQSFVYDVLSYGLFQNPLCIAAGNGYTYYSVGVNSSGIIYNMLWVLGPSGSSVTNTPIALDTYVTDLVAVDDYLYVTGQTYSSSWVISFPSVDAIDGSYSGAGDSYVAKLTLDLTCIYGTYIGGSQTEYGTCIGVENDIAYLGLVKDNGNSSEILRVPMNGDPITYNVTFDGSGYDYVSDIDVDSGIVYITGYTNSSDFPTVDSYYSVNNGGYDCFFASLSSDGIIEYTSYLGGSGDDYGLGIDEENSSIFIAGETRSTDFPMELAYDSVYAGALEGFITVFTGDTDFDGLVDWLENAYGTSPILIDTDNDNFLDYYEIIYGSNATDPTDYPAMPQVWYNEIYNNLDGNATLIQNLITWVNGNSSLLETVMQQLNENSTLLTQVIAWLDGNHTAIEALFSQLDGNATLLLSTVTNLNQNASLIDNLLVWSDGNYTLLLNTIQQLEDNATLLTQVISWLDGNHTSIETLFTQLDGNATLLMATVTALSGNSTIIQNLLTWSEGNATLIQTLSDQIATLEAVDVTQLIEWIEGNHTAIQNILAYIEGNATLLLSVVESLNSNEIAIEALSAFVTGNIASLNLLNATHIDDIEAIREILNQLGVSIGDSDYDGLDDLDELAYGTDVLCIDTDNDNLLDNFEIAFGTDPLNSDSDGDTYLDGLEVLKGTDPLDPLSYPGASTGIDLMLFVIAISGIGVLVILTVIIGFRKKKAG